MSLSVYMFIEHRYKGQWQVVDFKVPTFNGDMVTSDFAFPNGCHDIFSLLGYERGEYDEISCSSNGIPVDISNDLKKVIEIFDAEKEIKSVNLADLHVYLLTNPTVTDYDSIEEDAVRENPLMDVYKQAVEWMHVWTSASWIEWNESDVRIVGWVSR